MTARLLEGRTPADKILKRITRDVARLQPSLAIVQVGNHPSSEVYVARKLSAAMKIGMRTEHVRLDSKTSADAAERCLRELSDNPEVTGIILQLPLPAHLDKHRRRLLDAITPLKDVDGLSAENLGRLVAGEDGGLRPATPTGIVALLKHYKIAVAGKRAVIVGRSLLVGHTLSILLTQLDATVTVCHSRTKNLAALTKEADILVCAAGKPHLIRAPMVKKGAVCIDVGITRTAMGVRGDMHPGVAAKASALTPVPRGVGPMTVACLLQNCVLAAAMQRA